MKLLNRLGIVAIPLTFLLAGSGMFYLLAVDNTAGNFFQQIAVRESEWLIGHVLLLLSTVFIGPAALALRLAIRSGKAAVLATVMLVLILPTHLLLAGQYAIDFTVPLMVQIGGDALTLHGMLAQSVLVNTLFYALPNLVFLCLMILSVAVIASARLAKVPALILALNWLCVLLGNLIDPAFQRTAIVLLSLSFLPLVIDLWKEQG